MLTLDLADVEIAQIGQSYRASTIVSSCGRGRGGRACSPDTVPLSCASGIRHFVSQQHRLLLQRLVSSLQRDCV